MADRMKTFDKCIDELLKSVTSDMLHVDNLRSDLHHAAPDVKLSKADQERLKQLRQETIEEFKKLVKEEINEKLKVSLNLQQCFDDFKDKDLQCKKPWRINGDPQHDTFAQRRQTYLDYSQQLEEAEKNLRKEVESLTKSISNN